MARPLFDSEFIFGIHEPGGEQYMLEAGRPGWIVFTEGVGHDPNDQSGRDYRAYSDRGIGVIVRLNNGYYPNGTIPPSDRYAAFAQRCANFVANSAGCKLWIIGNEMNFDIERPRYSAQPPLTLQQAAPEEEGTGEPAPEEVEILLPAEPANFFQRWWNAFLRTISGGMGDAELGQPTPPPKPPAVRPPGAAPLPPELSDPRRRGDPSRFSALHPPAAPPPLLDDEAAADEPARPLAAPANVEVITPAKYAECYRLCREAILSVPGHASDQVLIGAVAPWNNQTTYPGNERGDWVAYMRDILALLGPEGCDGITLHTYTHASDKNLIYSEAKMGAPFTDRHYEFRAYRDFMNGIPQDMRHLPVYLTETDQDVAWLNQNIDWVKAAYGEIDYWNNLPGRQQIRALILYRWPRIDRWYIEGKQGVIEDFRQSLQSDFKWRVVLPSAAAYGIGDLLATRDFVNMRRSPGYVGKPADDVVAVLPEQAQVQVVDGVARSVDGLIWWQVKETEGNGRQGWLAQFSPAGLPLVRLLEKSAAPPDDALGVGSLAKTLTTVRLRRSPGYVNKPPEDTLGAIAPDTEVAITGGPTAADGLTWWQVRGIDAEQQPFSGWMAETAPGGERLLEKIGEIAPPGGGGDPGDTGKFQIGDRVQTLDFVRYRRTPGYQGKPANDVLGDLAPGTVGPVLGGPRTADELIWWNLRMALPDGAIVDGWAAETAPNGVELLSLAEEGGGETAGTFRPGDAALTQNIVRFRNTPGYVGKDEGDVIADVPVNTVITVVSGPRSVDGLSWWEVDAPVNGVTRRGWMAETAPDGSLLLAPIQGPPPPDGIFRSGELIQAQDTVRVRRSPGYVGKPDDDTLGAFIPKTTLNVIEGPREVDDLSWYRVGGIAVPGGELIGWVARTAPNGVTLLDRAPRLPGTNIPDAAAGSYLTTPFRGDFGISQLWGERPEVYGSFTYDGVPLKGHNGIDFLTPTGTELQAVDDGIVLAAVYNDPTGFGNYVLLRHGWGESLYAHMDGLAVQNEQTVTRGQFIGHSGSTGNSQGPHLHFAIRINPYSRTDGWGGYSDPLPYLLPAAVHLPDYVLPPSALQALAQSLGAPPAETEAASFAPGMNPDQPGVRRP